MAQNDYDATTKVVVREVRGEKRFTVGNAATTTNAGPVANAVDVSEFVDATYHYVTQVRGMDADAFEDGETVGVYGIRDQRPEDSDAGTVVRDYEEVEVEEAGDA